MSSVRRLTVVCISGAFFPVISRRHSAANLPSWSFFIAKHFGTGVITATAFIHVSLLFSIAFLRPSFLILARLIVQMLPSAFGALTNPCLPAVWNTTYPNFAGAFAMIAMFTIFFTEYFAIMAMDNGNDDTQDIRQMVDESIAPQETKHTTEAENGVGPPDKLTHFGHSHTFDRETLMNSRAQILGITILEVGICFHSVIIGMALSVSNGSDFISLLCALIFHQVSISASTLYADSVSCSSSSLTSQTFEGLGLGSRIADLKFHVKSVKPWLMSLAYGLTTPIGIVIGLGVRNTYDPNSEQALLVQGTLDSVSAGLLLYSAMVELLANDFIYDRNFRKSSALNQFSAFFLLLLGGGLMALIGRWA